MSSRLRSISGKILIDFSTQISDLQKCQREVENLERNCGVDHNETIQARDRLAKYYFGQNDAPLAIATLNENLRLQREKLGFYHHDCLVTVLNIASLAVTANMMDEAQHILHETIHGKENNIHDHDITMLLVCETIAALSRDSKNTNDAEKYYRAALNACEKLFEPTHDAVLENAGNLGNVLVAKGNVKGAEKYCRQAWMGFHQTLGIHDPNTLQSAFNLSVVLSTTGQFEEAEQLCEMVVRERAQALGRSHVLTLNSMVTYAGILRKRRKYADAEQVYKFLLKVREQQFGPESDEVHNCLVSLAVCKKERGEYGLANKLYEQVASASGKHLSAPVDAASLQAAEDAAHALAALGRLEEAENICRKVGKVYKQLYGDHDVRTMNSVYDLGKIYDAQGNFVKAERVLRVVVDCRESVFGTKHPETIDAKNHLAAALKGLEQFDEAEYLYQQVLNYRIECLGDTDLTTLTSMVCMLQYITLFIICNYL